MKAAKPIPKQPSHHPPDAPTMPAETTDAAAATAQAPMASVVPLHTHEHDVPAQAPGPSTQGALPLTLSRQERLVLRQLARALLIGGVIYTVVWLLWAAFPALIPFMFGLALAYILLPLVNRLNERMPRWAAILTVYAITLLAVSLVIAYIVPPLVSQVREFASITPNLDQLQQQANSYLSRIRLYIPDSLQEPFELGLRRSTTTIQNNITAYLSNVGQFLLSSIGRVLDTITFLIGFLVIPFWMFYVINDHKAGLRTVDSLLPQIIREDFWALARIFDRVFSNYIRGQLFLGLMVGIASGIGLFILNLLGFKVNYILLLALFAGTTELIPVIGPIIGAVPAIIVGSFDGFSTALAVIALYLIIQQLENQVLVPRIIGESVGIHPALMFILLAVGSQVFGLLGAILVAPTFAALRDIVVYLNQRLSNPLENAPAPTVDANPPLGPGEEQLLEREARA